MDYQGFQTTMSGGRDLPPDLVGTNVQPLPKVPEMPLDTDDEVAIFGGPEDEPQLGFSSLLEPTQEGQIDLVSLLEKDDKDLSDLYSLLETLTDNTSYAMMSQTQPPSAPVDIPLISIDSNTATQLGRFITDSAPQQKPVTPSNSDVGNEMLMAGFFTTQNFQQMPVNVGPGFVPAGPAQVQTARQSQRQPDMAGPQSQVAAAASTAASSTVGKMKKRRKTKEYERKTPYDDETRERRRKNAIKAKEYRNKKKQEGDDQLLQISRLQQENSNLIQANSNLTQQLMVAKQVIERQKKEQMQQNEMMKQMQQNETMKLMQQNEMMKQLLKQFGLGMMKHNG